MIASAGRTYLAVDSSKRDKSSFVKIADLSDVAAVVTECRPSDKWMQVFADMDLPCIFPPEG